MVIHHLDEDPRNNEPNNLVLFSSSADHIRYHMKLLKLRREGSEVDPIQLALEGGGQALPPPPAPLAFVPRTVPPDLVTRQQTKHTDQTAS
jgi:hypothetical protein